ncbi:MAG: BatD family protein [Bacteroidota bacterium]
MLKKILFILIFITSFACSASGEPKFTASVSKNPVGAGEQFQLTFALQDAGGSNFKPPNFKGFTLLMGPSQQQSMQIINGAMSRSVSFTYVLQADMQGSFTIGSASIDVDGKTMKTNPIQMQVQKGSPQAKPQQSDDEKNVDKQAGDIIKKNLNLKLNVNKNEVYPGEQIIATYTIYFHPELMIVNNSLTKEPSFTGFWSQLIDLGQISYRNETINGVPFKAAVIKKIVLIPQQTGKLSVDPMEFEFVIRLAMQNQRQRRSFFDDFFNRNSYKDFSSKVSSGTANINVKPLPGNAPADFKGGVGNLSFKAWLDKNQTKTNEPVTLKVQVSGTGNLKLIEPFGLNLPPDIETYDPKINDNINVSASGMSGTRTYEYILIPRNAGEFKIEPIKFAYFNPSNKKYITLSSDEFILKVEQGNATESSPLISGINKEDVKYIGKDIRFLKNTPSEFSRNEGRFFGSFLFWLMSLLPTVLFLFFFLYRKKQEKLQGNRMLLRNKKATKVARLRLSSAKKFLTANHKEKFYEEISKALWGYLGDKLGIELSELTKDSARISLSTKNVTDEKITKYMETIDYCEFARFAPSGQTVPIAQVYDDAVAVITDLEGIL